MPESRFHKFERWGVTWFLCKNCHAVCDQQDCPKCDIWKLITPWIAIGSLLALVMFIVGVR